MAVQLIPQNLLFPTVMELFAMKNTFKGYAKIKTELLLTSKKLRLIYRSQQVIKEISEITSLET